MDSFWRMSVQELQPPQLRYIRSGASVKNSMPLFMNPVYFQKNYDIPFLPMAPHAKNSPNRYR